MKEIKINVPEGYEIDKENSTLDCIRFKKIKSKLPKTWDEFCDTSQVKKGECFIELASRIQQISGSFKRSNKYDRFLWPSKEYAEAALALSQLLQLRDYYNNGWKPDWTKNEIKYVIYSYEDKIIITVSSKKHYILSFKTEELCREFFNNFKDLIEIAKPLL